MFSVCIRSNPSRLQQEGIYKEYHISKYLPQGASHALILAVVADLIEHRLDFLLLGRVVRPNSSREGLGVYPPTASPRARDMLMETFFSSLDQKPYSSTSLSPSRPAFLKPGSRSNDGRVSFHLVDKFILCCLQYVGCSQQKIFFFLFGEVYPLRLFQAKIKIPTVQMKCTHQSPRVTIVKITIVILKKLNGSLAYFFSPFFYMSFEK